MENKRTQRIIGIVVVIALVIILYPLLFSKSTPPAKTVAQNAESFPDQPPLAADANSSDTINELPGVSAEADASQPIQNTADITTDIANEVNKHIEAQANEVKTIDQPAGSVASAATNNSATQPVIPVKSSIAPLKTKTSAIKVEHKTIAPKIKNAHAKSATPELGQLKKTAWVVQMGSFRDKANARHLADKLRSAGYKAFMHEAKSGATRVFIGPEFKQTSALKLSSDVEHDTKMRGIVVLYKPLAI